MNERPPRVDVEVPDDIRRIWEEVGTPIVKVPAPVLREVAAPIATPTAEVRDLVERMKTAMRGARGVGLAAPQMGVAIRLFIYQLPEENSPLRVVLNPRIVHAVGEQIGPEGCLSIPLLQGDVKRAMEVTLKGQDMLGRPFKRRATEFEARIIQHEYDHLEGILFTDRADPDTLHWLLPEEAEQEPETIG